MSDLIERIDAAICRIANGDGPMRVPAEDTDPDMVLAECRKEIFDLCSQLEAHKAFTRRRFDLLQQMQSRMREPERTIVCDVLANGALLPDPDGVRYGLPKGPTP